MAIMAPKGLPETLKRLRAARGLSQRALGEKAGVIFVTIARIETAGLDPRLSTLTRLAAALGVRTADLVADVDRPAKVRRRPARRTRARRGRT
jgi:transcriptional regulator with XRE-family HTH domain